MNYSAKSAGTERRNESKKDECAFARESFKLKFVNSEILSIL